MPMLTEVIDAVVGADTHRDTHELEIACPTGAVIGTCSVSNDTAGYAQAVGWIAEHAPGSRVVVAVEGTRSYGSGLARALSEAGLSVVECEQPTRSDRRGRGKSERPAMELLFRWLEKHRPAPAPDALVHGDFRNGNLLVDDSGIRAVLDWEANAVTIVRRELRLGPTQREEHRARLQALGCPDDAALAHSIRSGSLPADRPDVVATVRASVTAQVMVTNPKYLAAPA